MFARSVVLVNSSNHQLLENLSFPIMPVMSVTSTLLANSSKKLILLMPVPLMQVILSFVIPLVSLFLILLVFVSQLNLLINLLMWTGNVLMNDLLIIRTVANIILQNELASLIFWWCPYIIMNLFLYFSYFIITFEVTLPTIFSKTRCNNFSTNTFLTSNSIAIFNIPHKNVLFSSIIFYHFSFSFYEYSLFINSVF